MVTARLVCAAFALGAGFICGRVRTAASDERAKALETSIKLIAALRKGVMEERKPLPAIFSELNENESFARILADTNGGSPCSDDNAAGILRKTISDLCGETMDSEERILSEAEERLLDALEKERTELAPKAKLTAKLFIMAGAAAAIIIL